MCDAHSDKGYLEITMHKFPAARSLGLSILLLCLFLNGCNSKIDNPVPKEIAHIKTGMSQNDVVQAVSGSGSHTIEEKIRPKLTWKMPRNPYYDNVEFLFTEKDRLFMIRYNTSGINRDRYQDIKKSFFELYDFSWEDPMKLKVGGNDALFYSPNDHAKSALFYLEITDKQTAAKSIELFNRGISAEDRAPKPKPQNDEPKPEAEAEKKNDEPNPVEPEPK
jgi:hypothetical protein